MVRRVFIYGRFLSQQEAFPSILPGILPSPLFGTPINPEAELSTEAVEILREPSILELVGKIYALTSGRNYQPVTSLGVRNYMWYQRYQHATANGEKFYFKVKDGDLWLVAWMRLESDETGSYIAVALKHS